MLINEFLSCFWTPRDLLFIIDFLDTHQDKSVKETSDDRAAEMVDLFFSDSIQLISQHWTLDPKKG